MEARPPRPRPPLPRLRPIRALRDLCNSSAVFPLRTRYTAETTDQVKLAISEALRILGQCGG